MLNWNSEREMAMLQKRGYKKLMVQFWIRQQIDAQQKVLGAMAKAAETNEQMKKQRKMEKTKTQQK